MNDIEKLKKAWYDENYPLGKKLGYPDCCIKAFCDQPPEVLKMMKKPNKDAQDRYKAGCVNGMFTGFIPCSEHAEQILSGKIHITNLIQNRDKDFLPFPLQFLNLEK